MIQPRRFKRLARLNIIPDIDERMEEIQSDPERYGYFLGIREQVGEGHDQFVDDMFSSRNGRVLYVSRPSLADVVAINLRTRKIIWRTKVDGNRADHMAISPDGRHVLVSASTAKVIDVIDTKTGAIVARIPSGDQPHENNFSKRRQARLPREHRLGLHAARRPAARRLEGRARLRGHRREQLAGAAAGSTWARSSTSSASPT